MRIIEATYGNDTNAVEVTERLQTLVRNERLFLTVSNALFSDPSPGRSKSLRFIYSIGWDDHRYSYHAEEHEIVFLPRSTTKNIGIFYSDLSIPMIYLTRVLRQLVKAQDVDILTCPWRPISGNPFPELQWNHHVRSHVTLILQILKLLHTAQKVGSYEYVFFLEHDVLYPEGYFDIREFSEDVLLNTNYIGLCEIGFQMSRKGQQPLHQLTMRLPVAIQHFTSLLPEALLRGSVSPEPYERTWATRHSRQPAVHINHGKNFTTHFKFYSHDDIAEDHPYWGPAKYWWDEIAEITPGKIDDHRICLEGDASESPVMTPERCWGRQSLPADRRANKASDTTKLIGICIVRNEVDVIRLSVLHHLAIGLDRILIVDNGSTDGTVQVLEELHRKDHRVQWQSNDSPYKDVKLRMELVREAVRQGADWIVPFDADEFWWVGNGDIRAMLGNAEAGALEAQVINFVQHRSCLDASEEGLLTMTRSARVAGVSWSLLDEKQIAYVEKWHPPKWISRPTSEIEIGPGNHSVSGVAGRKERTSSLVVLHAPLRSRACLNRKADHGERILKVGSAPNLSVHLKRWARLRAAGLLEQEWAANSYLGDSLDVYGQQHDLDVDLRLREAVAPFLPR